MQETLQDTGPEFGRLLARPVRPDGLRREVDEALAARRVIAPFDIDMAALIAERGAEAAGEVPSKCRRVLAASRIGRARRWAHISI